VSHNDEVSPDNSASSNDEVKLDDEQPQHE